MDYETFIDDDDLHVVRSAYQTGLLLPATGLIWLNAHTCPTPMALCILISVGVSQTSAYLFCIIGSFWV